MYSLSKVTLSKDKIPNKYHVCHECSSRLDFHQSETQEIWSDGTFHGRELKCPVCDNISCDAQWTDIIDTDRLRSDLESLERRFEILKTNLSWRNMARDDAAGRLSDRVDRFESRLSSLLYGVLGIVLTIFVCAIAALLRQV